MPNSFKQFAELWGRMKNGQRAAVIGGAAATLALLGALVYYSSQPEYGVLFADLKPADAQGIVEKLKAANVPYQLNSGGTAVSVPSERISELRLQIASSGALSGGHVGFDIFDRNSFGATDFAQQVNYQRALEGELARTLEGMDEVESARVHITRPQESLFADKEQRAKASVVLRIRQSRELARERTEAVINLVSSAVEGLDTADVSVMDARGRLLSAPTRAGSLADAGAFNSHLEARRRFEAETAARIISMLEPVTGAGHVRADVAADIDFSHVDQTEEKFNPQSAVIRSQQTSQEVKTNGTNAGPAGIVGARANDPAAQALAAAAQPAPQVNLNPSQPGAQRAATTTNYEIDRTVRHTVGGGGNLTRLSVSVMVDYKIVNGVATTRTPEELQKIQQLVAAAVGVNQQRGDQIVVDAIPFDQPAADATTQPWIEKYRDLLRTGIKYGLLVLAALVLVLFVLRPARRALKAAAAASEPLLLTAGAHTSGSLPALAAAGAGGGAVALTAAQTDAISFGSESGADAPRTVAELEAAMDAEVAREFEMAVPQVNRAGAIKKAIVEQTLKNPDMVAMTVRGWLQDSK